MCIRFNDEVRTGWSLLGVLKAILAIGLILRPPCGMIGHRGDQAVVPSMLRRERSWKRVIEFLTLASLPHLTDLATSEQILIQGNRARAVRISQEVSSLATSLPVQPESSIFLRVDEERFDVMRALITGPQDTPYEVSRIGKTLNFGEASWSVGVVAVNVSFSTLLGLGSSLSPERTNPRGRC